MGLFRSIIAKLRGCPQPKVLYGLEDGATQVVCEIAGNIHIMDRDHFDYLYVGSNAPSPSQKALNRLLPNVNRIRAFAGGMCRGRPTTSEVVLDTSDADAIAAFRSILSIKEDPATFDHCACAGGPTLDLFAGEKLVATIGVQHGHSIRWNQWKYDARLLDGPALLNWLTRNGIEPELLDRLLHNHYHTASLSPLGFRRGGLRALSRAEQQLRLIEVRRAGGGDIERALVDCQRVVDENPNLGLGFAVRAIIHSQLGDHAHCLADCNEALRLGLCEAEIYFARAVAHDHAGATEEAISDCTKALEINPAHANALNSRGLIRSRLGMVDEAIDDFNAAIKSAPDWYLPYLNRSQTYLTQLRTYGVFDDSDRVIELIGSSSPENRRILAVAYANRGEAHRLNGDNDLAQQDFEEADRLLANRPKPRDTAHCSYCERTGDCYCERNGIDSSTECVICHGTRKCPLCQPTPSPD